MLSTLSPPDGGSPAYVMLPANPNTLAAEDLRVQLVMAVDSDEDVTIDAGEAGLVGQAVLQLLVAADRAVQDAGKSLSIINCDAELCGRLTALGLADTLTRLPQEED